MWHSITLFLFQLLAALSMPWKCRRCTTYLPMLIPNCRTCPATLGLVLASDRANNGSWLCGAPGCYSLNESHEEKCGRRNCGGKKSTELLLGLKGLMERAGKMVAPNSNEEEAVKALYNEAQVTKGRSIEGKQLPPELRGNVMELVAKWTELILEKTYGLEFLPYTVSYLYKFCHVLTTKIYLEKKEHGVRGGRVDVKPGLILVECDLLQKRKRKEEMGKEDLDRLKEMRMKLRTVKNALDAADNEEPKREAGEKKVIEVRTSQKTVSPISHTRTQPRNSGEDRERQRKEEQKKPRGVTREEISHTRIQPRNSGEDRERQRKEEQNKPRGVTREEITGTRGRGKTFEAHALKLEAESRTDELMMPTESKEMPDNWKAPTRRKFYYLMKPVGEQTKPTMLIATMPIRSNFVLFGQSLERIDSAVLDKYQHCTYIRFNWSDLGKIDRPPYYAKMKEKRIDLVRSPAEKRRREKDQEKKQKVQTGEAEAEENEKQEHLAKRQKIVMAHQDIREKEKEYTGPTKDDQLKMTFKSVKVQGFEMKIALNYDNDGNCLCCSKKQYLLYCGNPVIFTDWATMVMFRKNYAQEKQGRHPVVCAVQFATPLDLQCVVENQKEIMGHVFVSGANEDGVFIFLSQCLYSSGTRTRLPATHYINSYSALHATVLARDAALYSIRPIKRNVEEEKQLDAYIVANYMETCSDNCLDYILAGAKFEEVGWEEEQKQLTPEKIGSIAVLEPSMTGKELIDYTAPPRTIWKPVKGIWNQIGKMTMKGEEEWYQLLKRDIDIVCEEREERREREEEKRKNKKQKKRRVEIMPIIEEEDENGGTGEKEAEDRMEELDYEPEALLDEDGKEDEKHSEDEEQEVSERGRNGSRAESASRSRSDSRSTTSSRSELNIRSRSRSRSRSKSTTSSRSSESRSRSGSSSIRRITDSGEDSTSGEESESQEEHEEESQSCESENENIQDHRRERRRSQGRRDEKRRERGKGQS